MIEDKVGRIVKWSSLWRCGIASKIHFYLLICLFKPCCVDHVVLRRRGRQGGGEGRGIRGREGGRGRGERKSPQIGRKVVRTTGECWASRNS